MATTRSAPARSTAVWVLPLDSGCGICVQQIFALQSTRFAGEMAKRGIRFARSPRHADILLLTGPLAAAAREPLRRVLGAVPDPRALVAVGNCAIDGCVFRGSPNIIDAPADELDVNVEIAGCPPAPEAILDAIAEAALLLAGQSRAGGANDESGEHLDIEPLDQADEDADAADDFDDGAEDTDDDVDEDGDGSLYDEADGVEDDSLDDEANGEPDEELSTADGGATTGQDAGDATAEDTRGGAR